MAGRKALTPECSSVEDISCKLTLRGSPSPPPASSSSVPPLAFGAKNAIARLSKAEALTNANTAKKRGKIANILKNSCELAMVIRASTDTPIND